MTSSFVNTVVNNKVYVDFFLALSLKGPCHNELFFLYDNGLVLLSSRTYLLTQSDLWLSQNLAKTENPGTSKELKTGYPEQNQELKMGYPEQKQELKTGYPEQKQELKTGYPE